MPDPDLSNEDWLDLYQFLLQRLDEKGLEEFRREVESVVTAPVSEEATDAQQAWILKEFKGEVGQTALRPREPSEVFAAAMDVIWTRLTEFPTIVMAIETKLQIDAAHIEFRVDYEQQYAPRRSEPINLARLRLTEQETLEISAHLTAIGVVPERLV